MRTQVGIIILIWKNISEKNMHTNFYSNLSRNFSKSLFWTILLINIIVNMLLKDNILSKMFIHDCCSSCYTHPRNDLLEGEGGSDMDVFSLESLTSLDNSFTCKQTHRYVETWTIILICMLRTVWVSLWFGRTRDVWNPSLETCYQNYLPSTVSVCFLVLVLSPPNV